MTAIFLLPILFFATAIGPGYSIVRRFRFAPLETFAGSIAVSLFLVYLATFAIFISGIDIRACWLITIAGGLISLFSARDLLQLLRHPRVRPAAVGLLILLAWSLLLTCCIRHYSGGDWSNDWLEHYQRSQFFLHVLPLDYQFIERYTLPARPPMMNLLVANILAQTSDRFEIFQLTSSFLSTLIFIPCCLFLHRFTRRPPIAALVCAFMLSPVFIQNDLFPWTKLLCGFYCLLAVHFYLRGWRKRDSVRTVAVFVCFAIAILVHYSAGPWLVVIVLHYLWRTAVRRDVPAKQFAISIILPALILLTWFAWSFHAYGSHTTLASNTAVADSEKRTLLDNIEKVGHNLARSLLPHPFFIPLHSFRYIFDQQSALGMVRDYALLLYQPNYIFSIGATAGPIALLLLWRLARKRSIAERRNRAFWFYFIPAVAFLGVAVHGAPVVWGAAHICLTPLTLLAVTFVIANFPRLSLSLRVIAVAGFAIDFVFGVLLQLIAEGRITNIIHLADSDHVVIDAYSLSRTAIEQYDIKLTQHLIFLGDYFAAIQPALLVATAIGGGVALLILSLNRRSRQ